MNTHHKLLFLLFGWLFLGWQNVLAQQSIEYKLWTDTAISVPFDSLNFPPNSFYSGDIDLLSYDTLNFIIHDLNKDNFEEYILLSGCGNGGCVETIFNGQTKINLGQIFGEPIFVSSSWINNWPVLFTFSHQSADSGLLFFYVFDGEKYIQISRILLYEKTITKYFKSIN